MSAAFKIAPADIADMRATAARNRLGNEAQTRSRPSTVLNMLEGDTAIDELAEVVAKKQALIAQLHVLATIESDLRLILQISGKI